MAKLLELQLQHQSFQRVFRFISFRIDWFDLLAVQGPLKSLLQHHSSKASILWCSDINELIAAESLQSYPTLHDPRDCSLPGSSIPGIFQARVLEWGAIAFSEEKPISV